MRKICVIILGLLCQLFAIAQLDTDHILAIGKNALFYDDYVLSIQYFNQVIKSKPYLAEPYLYRATAKIQLGDFQGAETDCSEALDKNPFIHRAYYLRGFARKKLELFDESSSDFTKALDFSPNDSSYLMNRIESYARGKKYEKAFSDIDYFLKLNPKRIDFLHYKGSIQLELKDTVGAKATYNKIIDIDSTNCLGWSGRALVKIICKDNDGALSDYNNAIIRNSTFAGDYVNRGNINNDKKNYNQALSDYDRAVRLDSTDYLVYFNRGLLRSFLGDKNNAILDFNKVIRLDSTKIEAHLQKAILDKSLRNYQSAIKEFTIVLSTYPYYIPAYEELADIEDALGNNKNAYSYRLKAKNIELNKKYYDQKTKEKFAAKKEMAINPQKTMWKANGIIFSEMAMQNNVDSANVYTENFAPKGSIQNRFVNLTNEKNFLLSFIPYKFQIRRTNLYIGEIEKYNKSKIVLAKLGISNIEIPLTPELANYYFDAISKTSDSIVKDNKNADLYFSRAMGFCSVKDYLAAAEDLDKAIELKPNYLLAIFSRANISHKLMEINNGREKTVSQKKESNVLKNEMKLEENQFLPYSYNSILKDYNKVIQINPDFAFAYYNKANILNLQKDFKAAIFNYSKTIEIDPDFAEAYFNRGLTYLFIGETSKGLIDLSKAGELGIYSAYNLIQRFKK